MRRAGQVAKGYKEEKVSSSIPPGTLITGTYKANVRCAHCDKDGLWELSEKSQQLTGWQWWCRDCQHLVITQQDAEARLREMTSDPLKTVGFVAAVHFPLDL